MVDLARIVCDRLNVSGLVFWVSSAPGMIILDDWTGVDVGRNNSVMDRWRRCRAVIICGDTSCHVRCYGSSSRATLRAILCRRFLFADPDFFDNLIDYVVEYCPIGNGV